MPRPLFVVNPTAGEGRGLTVWRELQERLDEMGQSYRVLVSQRAGEIPALVRKELEGEVPDRVVAVGGDGTISEVVNGFAPDQIPLGVIPAGSGNDFARQYNIPRDPTQALEVCLNGHVQRADLATVNSHYLINVGGAGFDAVVAAETNRLGKRLGSKIPYVIALLKTLISYRNEPIIIDLDGEQIETRALLVAVGNGQYLGGGMHILPTADSTDGLLDVCIGGDLTKPEVLSLLPKIYKGKHVGHPKVTMRRARRVTITSRRPIYYQADGEPIGKTPVTFEVKAGKLLVLTSK